MKNTKEIMRVLKFILKTLEICVITLIIITSLIIVIQRVSNNEKSFFGYRIFKVETGSMIPAYNVGDVLLVKEKKIEELTEGDVITYNGKSGNMKGKTVTHRIINIERSNGTIYTKGDANNLADPEIKEEQVIGKVIAKSKILTVITNLLNNKYIFYFFGIVPLTIYVFFSMVRYNDKVEKRIKERNRKV